MRVSDRHLKFPDNYEDRVVIGWIVGIKRYTTSVINSEKDPYNKW